MCSDTRPGPVLGLCHQPRPDRIQADITNCRNQMRFVHGYRRETALKQVARPAAPRIDEIGVAAMCFSHRAAEAIRLPRIQDQVHVVLALGSKPTPPRPLCAPAPKVDRGKSPDRRLQRKSLQSGLRATTGRNENHNAPSPLAQLSGRWGPVRCGVRHTPGDSPPRPSNQRRLTPFGVSSGVS